MGEAGVGRMDKKTSTSVDSMFRVLGFGFGVADVRGWTFRLELA